MSGTSFRPEASNSGDVLIRDEIVRALHGRGYPSLWNVTVSVHSGHVSLAGCVPTYFLRQVAQTAAMSVRGVQRVEAALDVC